MVFFSFSPQLLNLLRYEFQNNFIIIIIIKQEWVFLFDSLRHGNQFLFLYFFLFFYSIYALIY